MGLPVSALRPLRLLVSALRPLRLCDSALKPLRLCVKTLRLLLQESKLDLFQYGAAFFVKDITVLVDLKGIHLDTIFVVCLN